MFVFSLPKIAIEVAYLTDETVLLSGVVNSKYSREQRVVAEEAIFRGYHELFCKIVFD